MVPPRRNWAAALRSVADGDQLAFLQLSRLITCFLRDFCPHDRAGEWDDVIQDVIWSAIQADANGQIRSHSSVMAFLRVSTRNRLIDRHRKGSRETAVDPISELGLFEDLAEAADEGVDLLEAADLWRAVERLPEEQKSAIVSIYGEGRTYREAADETGIPLGSFKRYLKQGLERLARSLGPGFEAS